MEDILLCVCSPPDLEIDVFSCWVGGTTIAETIKLKIDQFKASSAPFPLSFTISRDLSQGEISEIITDHVRDQYRTFQILEHFLQNPALLNDQTLCIVDVPLRNVLVEKYWALDDVFVREVLNKRLTKSRKDLEDASELTELNLRRITRQFDNIKRVYNAFDDQEENNIYLFLTKNFRLTHELAVKYACIIYLLSAKFNLNTKKRLQNTASHTLEECVALFLVLLCINSPLFFQHLSQHNLTGIVVGVYR
jgi:hypothetical protein